jgi:hypothetical protein
MRCQPPERLLGFVAEKGAGAMVALISLGAGGVGQLGSGVGGARKVVRLRERDGREVLGVTVAMSRSDEPS